ncbi:MAG TPA: AAA family ATPase [Ktedonobacterales bacterium]|jgi:DNA-binding CsgD family transcriptional regulator|nr:AAA family ATPase [Ktedonobacterales bacterium]
MQRHQGEGILENHLLAGTSVTLLAQPSLVGRNGEVNRLTTLLARTARRQGGALFLVGETGIGKTRLAQEALTLAREQGFLVLASPAYALESGLAYAPILAAFGPFLRRLDSARRARLVSGLVDLGRLFTDLHLPAAEPLGDPALEKTRLFETVARLLERLAQERPVLLFLDDLHWADPASIELLHYVARGVADQAVLLLGTYRAEEVDTARGLRSLVTSLRRAGLAEEVVLARLEPEAVAELAAGMLGSAAPDDLLTLLDARASGTPLFVEGLIRALIDADQLRQLGEGWTLGTDLAPIVPPDIRDLILERLRHLDATGRRVLDLIAVSGGTVPHTVLREAGEWSDEFLLEAVQRLRTNGLVAEDLTGAEVTYTLTHPLIQEVAYAQLPEMARRRAHAATADALERLRPDDLDRLARHIHAAGPQVDPRRALDVLLAAGERAAELYANDQAARHFGAALALIREGHRSKSLPTVLERLGEAWERVGETAAAAAVWSEALAEYEQLRDVPAQARLRRQLALAEWDRGHFASAQAHLEAGFQALAGREPSPVQADLLHIQEIFLRRLDDSQGAHAVAQELATLAEQLESPKILVEAALAQVGLYVERLDFAGAREASLHSLSEAEAAHEPILVQRAHDLLALLAYTVGDHALARHYAQLSLATAHRLGAPVLEAHPRVRLVLVDLMAGKWDEAVRESAAVVALARRLSFARGIAGALSIQALTQAYRGDLEAAARSLAETQAVFGGGARQDHHIFNQVAVAEMALALEQGDAASAQDAGEKLQEQPTGGGFFLQALALIAEAQNLVGEPERALASAQDLITQAPPDNVFAFALGSRVAGLAQLALGQPTAALMSMEQALRAFTAAEMPFEAARVRLDWATANASEVAAAAPAAQESLTTFERLGAKRYARRARRLLHQLGIHPRSPLQTRQTRSDGAAVSPREREVIRLVAEDLTNAEIAERLIISPRTVTTHLDRIYTRLGINSRTALVRYALEAGLLLPNP